MSEQRPAPGVRRRVLLVEDSPHLRAVLIEFIQTVSGIELVGAAATAAEAMAAFESNPPDAVILDLVLEAGSGLDVLRDIKQRAPACRVLVFTAHDGEPYRTRCLAAGADHFFSKNRQHRELMRQLQHLGGEARLSSAQLSREETAAERLTSPIAGFHGRVKP